VILGLTFLEHFIQWKDPLATLEFGAAAALVVAALVFFERHSHTAKDGHDVHDPTTQIRAQRSMFREDHETAEIVGDETQQGDAGHDSGPPK
jgi:hypothetical protein